MDVTFISVTPKKNRVAAFALFCITLLSSLPALSNDQHLFYTFQASDSSKNSLSDDLYVFYNSSPEHIDYPYHYKDIYSWFNDQVAFMSDGRVIGNPTNIHALTLLDKNYKLVLVDNNDTIRINDKDYTHDIASLKGRKYYGFIHILEGDSVESTLNTPARSFYRLANFFGLAKVSEDINNGVESVSHCQDIIGNQYLCDNTKNGPLGLVGNILTEYIDQCNDCDDIDNSLLYMVAAHHLLRSGDKKSREKGGVIFRKHQDNFIDIDGNYRDLRDIYLKTLTLN